MIVLSERQAELATRLETLCQRAAASWAPIRVKEVWAYGSFIRGKDRPADLDIAITYSGHHDLWDDFRVKMNQVVSIHEKSPSEYPSPSIALEAFTSKSGGDGGSWEVFSRWAKCFSWNMACQPDYTSAGVHAYSPARVTTRVLCEGLPGLRLNHSFAESKRKLPLLAKAFALAWSDKRRDVKANISRMLSPSVVRRNVIVELENFERQVNYLKAEIKAGRPHNPDDFNEKIRGASPVPDFARYTGTTAAIQEQTERWRAKLEALLDEIEKRD